MNHTYVASQERRSSLCDDAGLPLKHVKTAATVVKMRKLKRVQWRDIIGKRWLAMTVAKATQMDELCKIVISSMNPVQTKYRAYWHFVSNNMDIATGIFKVSILSSHRVCIYLLRSSEHRFICHTFSFLLFFLPLLLSFHIFWKIQKPQKKGKIYDSIMRVWNWGGGGESSSKKGDGWQLKVIAWKENIPGLESTYCEHLHLESSMALGAQSRSPELHFWRAAIQW